MLYQHSTIQDRKCQDFRPTERSPEQHEKSARITPSAFSCSINAKLHVSIHRGKPLNGRMPDSKCYDYIIPTGCCAVKPFPASPPTDPGPSCPRNLLSPGIAQLGLYKIVNAHPRSVPRITRAVVITRTWRSVMLNPDIIRLFKKCF